MARIKSQDPTPYCLSPRPSTSKQSLSRLRAARLSLHDMGIVFKLVQTMIIYVYMHLHTYMWICVLNLMIWGAGSFTNYRISHVKAPYKGLYRRCKGNPRARATRLLIRSADVDHSFGIALTHSQSLKGLYKGL